MRTKVEHPEQLNTFIFARHLPWEGHLYISNRAPADDAHDEIMLIAEEVREVNAITYRAGRTGHP